MIVLRDIVKRYTMGEEVVQALAGVDRATSTWRSPGRRGRASRR